MFVQSNRIIRKKCREPQMMLSTSYQMEPLTSCKGLLENLMHQLEATVKLLEKQDAESRQLQKDFHKLVKQQIQLIKKDIRRQREVAQKIGRKQKVGVKT
jgi:hypothetical protein